MKEDVIELGLRIAFMAIVIGAGTLMIGGLINQPDLGKRYFKGLIRLISRTCWWILRFPFQIIYWGGRTVIKGLWNSPKKKKKGK